MYKIKWRNRSNKDFKVSVGCGSYPTKKLAKQQVSLWKMIFPHNTYYIV